MMFVSAWDKYTLLAIASACAFGNPSAEGTVKLLHVVGMTGLIESAIWAPYRLNQTCTCCPDHKPRITPIGIRLIHACRLLNTKDPANPMGRRTIHAQWP